MENTYKREFLRLFWTTFWNGYMKGRVMVDQCERLSQEFKKMEAEGLVDVKFLLRNTDEATAEEVCDEVYEMLAAYKRGDAVDLDFQDALATSA